MLAKIYDIIPLKYSKSNQNSKLTSYRSHFRDRNIFLHIFWKISRETPEISGKDKLIFGTLNINNKKQEEHFSCYKTIVSWTNFCCWCTINLVGTRLRFSSPSHWRSTRPPRIAISFFTRLEKSMAFSLGWKIILTVENKNSYYIPRAWTKLWTTN